MNRIDLDNSGVIAFPPALYAVTLFTGLVMSNFLPISLMPRLITLPLAGLAIIGAGLISFSAFRLMNRAQTAIDPSKPTTAIVSEGVFSMSRNPLYLSLTLLYVGISLFFNAGWALILLVPLQMIVQVGVIAREEEYLERKFGEEYLAYKERVRRWI